MTLTLQRFLKLLVLLLSLTSLLVWTRGEQAQTQPAAELPPCTTPFPLPNPSEIGARKFEKTLYDFLDQRCYRNWVADSRIRDSGPFIGGVSFGTHNSVRIFYSPDVWHWLKVKQRAGEIPDHAMIVKEMFDAPAVQGSKVTGWTVMVKDKKGSFDGWYWSFRGVGWDPPNKHITYPDSGFGLYCLRCHASAEKESTFIALKNVEGDPISFNVLVPTMKPDTGTPAPLLAAKDEHKQVATTAPVSAGPFASPLKKPDPNFLKLFPAMPRVTAAEVKSFPGESLDHVIAEAGGPKGYLTSSQCLGCHGASNENMAFLFADAKKKPINLSPYTEWRASMMGLAGRDPIFHAQLESEKALYPGRAEFLDNTCYRCHGVMGQRQLEADKKQSFDHGIVYALPEAPNGKYGALARDGISCAVCHQMAKEGLGTTAVATGLFKQDPPDVVNGPYEEVSPWAMKQAMGITPRFGDQIKSSALCGTCHMVVLPVFDSQGRAVLDKQGKPKEFHEQMTYPEWQNSIYQNEREPVDRAAPRTSPDCHIQRPFMKRPLVFRVANIEDATYPYTDYRAPDKELNVRVRDQYSRHTLIGLNQFGLMMFQQFPLLLGIRTADYMYEAAELGLATAQNSSNEMARNETAKIEVTSLERTTQSLDVDVRVENLAGHGFPSGVGFRRAFLTFEVLDAGGKVVWASGRTNSVGAIVSGVSEDVLPTEFFYDPMTRKQVFQPHYEVINSELQVQIYEEVIADPQGKITTSFTALDKVLKNNRLLPKGWRQDGPFGEFTAPHGEAERDKEYVSQSGATGADRLRYRIPLERIRNATQVKVTLNYQAIPPSYLRDRFAIGRGVETQRLAYLTSHLNLANSPIDGWKLPIVTATRTIPQ
jgi:mono/diheme cytochrome c family protein